MARHHHDHPPTGHQANPPHAPGPGNQESRPAPPRERPRRRPRRAELPFDTLEARCVPALVSAALSGGILDLRYDDQPDLIQLHSAYGLVSDGSTQLTYRIADVFGIRVSAGGGNDVIDVRALGRNVPTTLEGGSGDDLLIGGKLNDALKGGPGRDVLIGGDGNDALYLGDPGDTTSEPTSGTILDPFGTGSLIIGGGGGNDLIVGTDAPEILLAGPGNDTIVGSGGNDVIGIDTSDPAFALKYRYNFQGGPGNDAITGGALADSIDGADGADTLNGLAGDDLISGGSGDDLIDGGDGNDSLSGGADNDTIGGGSGHDLLSGNAGADQLDGNDGDDVLQLADDGDGNPFAPEVAADSGTSASESDTLHGGAWNGDILFGGVGNDLIVGDFSASPSWATPEQLGADVIFADAGDDAIDAGGGDNTIDGGDGNDTITSGDGADAINAGSGDDLVMSGNGADTVDLGAGLADVLDAGSGDDNVTDPDGGVVLLGDGDDRFQGGTGPVTVYGGEGDDSLTGSSGDDDLEGEGGDDSLDGGDGNDMLLGGAGKNLLRGGGGDDYIALSDDDTPQVVDLAETGGAGNDTIMGGSGNDVFTPGLDWVNAGIDAVYGEAGDDRFQASPAGGRFYGEGGNDTLIGDASGDILDGGDGDDSINGGDGGDSLSGGSGNDQLLAGGGSDTVLGGDGNDTISGGAGVGSFGIDDIDGGSGVDVLIEENLSVGTLANARLSYTRDGFSGLSFLAGFERAGLTGTNGKDSLNAFAFGGPVTLSGLGGDDSLAGGAFADQLDGGDGNNFLAGNDGGDTLISGAGRDTLLGGNGSDSLDAGGGDDTLIGADGNDSLIGGDGNDSLQGGVGNDLLKGLGGNDAIDGGDGLDNIEAGDGNDAIRAGADPDTINGGSGNDTIDGGLSPDTILGASGDDLLLGGDGADLVIGGEGADTIDGGLGTDTVLGGGGADEFRFSGPDDLDLGVAYDIDADEGDRRLRLDPAAPKVPTRPIIYVTTGFRLAAASTVTTGTPRLSSSTVATSGPTFMVGDVADGNTLVLVRDGRAVGSRIGGGLVADSGLTPEGTRSYASYQIDSLGFASPLSQATSLVIDRTAPDAPSGLTLVAADDSGLPGDGLTSATRPTISGSAEPGASVAWLDADGNILGTTLADGNGSFSIRPDGDLPQGQQLVSIQVADAAGNRSRVGKLTLSIDSESPATPEAPRLRSGEDTGVGNDNRTTLTRPGVVGTTEPGATVSWLDAAGRLVARDRADAQGNYALRPSAPFADGVQFVRIQTSDAAGNVSAQGTPLTLIIDTTAPAPVAGWGLDPSPSYAGQPDAVLQARRPVLHGRTEAGATVEILDANGAVVGKAVADAAGKFSARVTAPMFNGTSTLGLRVADVAGNVSTRHAVAKLSFRSIEGDIDGDGKADPILYRPADSTIVAALSLGGTRTVSFKSSVTNAATAVPIAADFDGDGKADLGVFDSDSGRWTIQRTASGTWGTSFGQPGNDRPVVADYDGDGKADLAVFRPTTSQWFVLLSAGGSISQQFGGIGDQPVPADYDGKGRAQLGVYRPVSSTWVVRDPLNSKPKDRSTQFGALGDQPAPSDYLGLGRAQFGMFRSRTGQMFIRDAAGGQSKVVSVSPPGSDLTPVALDYDGDGRADAASLSTGSRLFTIVPSSGARVRRILPGGAASGATAWAGVPVLGTYVQRNRVGVRVGQARPRGPKA